ncbi:LCP family protein [Kitasatospora sp. DSM 101779]|uniref:LCP family protein n=1 Tax=Kitasatospora sp. DSM 101779 TaxID=2853165 RepID=UPI0021DA629C|nr:LCP family protein [Kitasatospora sp. DSM 101779]
MAAGVLSLAVLATSCGGWVVLHGLGEAIQRVDAIGGGSDRPADDGLTTFLVAGTDEREGIPENTLKNVLHAGGESCHCTDTLMVVQLAGNGGRATVVSIPRDSYVEIPAHQDPATHLQVPAAKGKINAAYGMGGAPLTVRTVEQATGLRIDHYLQIDFLGFVSAVDALGGVEVCTAKPLKDPYSGLDLPAGTSRLDGAGALKYVRARHVDGSSDLGRMHRQQRFVAQLLRQATAQEVLLDPARLGTVLGSTLKAVKADKGLSTGALLDFASRLKDLSAASADFATVPVSDVDHQVPGWGSTVLWDTKAAKALFDTVRQGKPLTEHSDPVPSVSPAPGTPSSAAAGTVPAGQIRVQVLNGTGLTGLGFRVDEELRRAGFATTGTPSNANAVTARTAVRYDPRWDESARTLAAALPGAELVPVPGLGATLQVVVGGDHRGPAAPGTTSSAVSSAPAPAAAPAAAPPAASASPGSAVAAETGSEISCS